jgi:hypothetical protein
MYELEEGGTQCANQSSISRNIYYLRLRGVWSATII